MIYNNAVFITDDDKKTIQTLTFGMTNIIILSSLSNMKYLYKIECETLYSLYQNQENQESPTSGIKMQVHKKYWKL